MSKDWDVIDDLDVKRHILIDCQYLNSNNAKTGCWQTTMSAAFICGRKMPAARLGRCIQAVKNASWKLRGI